MKITGANGKEYTIKPNANLEEANLRGQSQYDYVSFKYEFPGGKLEANESREEALIREIKEELNYDIQIEQRFLTVEHRYPDFQLLMHSYLCTAKDTHFILTEHINYKWLTVNQLDYLDWAAADMPIVEKLMRNSGDCG